MLRDDLAPFIGAGLALVSIPPRDGKPSKAPNKGWNQPRSATNPGGYSSNIDDFLKCGNDCNFGLFHGASGTLALDIDDMERTIRVFDKAAETSLPAWFDDTNRAEVKSPKPDRGKLLFKLPDGFAAPGCKQFKVPKQDNSEQFEVIFELRCGSCQDVISGHHPEGGCYRFIGDTAAIPEAPPILLDILEHWDEWKPCFESALGIEQEPPKIASRKPQSAAQLNGWRNPIDEFNQSASVVDVLSRNGYRQTGLDRFIRPGSKSKAAGVAILRNCKDGIERIYSHGGDVLNDGFAHDAFDCFRLLECGGDETKALGWNPEITKHNQRLYRQEQDQKAADSWLQLDGDDGPGQNLFPLIPASELVRMSMSLDWLLDGVIERKSLNLLFGDPGSGKSLFALDWAFCIAAGMDWHDHQTRQVDVVVIAGEGFHGIKRRVKALEMKYQVPAPANLFISEHGAQLLDTRNTEWVANTIRTLCPNPGLVIIDTLHRNMEGDENSSQDIGIFIRNLDSFIKPLGAAVLIVHHSGHGDKNRSRGSSSIRAAMDGEFCCSVNEGGIVKLTCHKAKDFEPFKAMQFGLNTVFLDSEDDDEPVSSVNLKYEGDAQLGKTQRKLSGRDQTILTSLQGAIDAHGIEPPQDIVEQFGGLQLLEGNSWKVVALEHWREKAYPRLVADTPDAKRKAFKRCRDKLVKLGKVQYFDDYWWPV